MLAIVTIGLASWLKVALYIPTNWAGFTRSKIAATIPARKQAVPDAVSQFSVKTAP